MAADSGLRPLWTTEDQSVKQRIRTQRARPRGSRGSLFSFALIDPNKGGTEVFFCLRCLGGTDQHVNTLTHKQCAHTQWQWVKRTVVFISLEKPSRSVLVQSLDTLDSLSVDLTFHYGLGLHLLAWARADYRPVSGRTPYPFTAQKHTRVMTAWT